MASHCDFPLWLLIVASQCGFSMWLLNVASQCGFPLLLHLVASPALWLHTVTSCHGLAMWYNQTLCNTNEFPGNSFVILWLISIVFRLFTTHRK